MKTSINILTIFLAFIYVPMATFMQFLVYNHIHATELMWFLFWVNVPFSILSIIIGNIAQKLNK